MVKEILGNFKIQDITTQMIYSKLLKAYIDDGKLAMANRFRVKLNQLFKAAIKQELIIIRTQQKILILTTPLKQHNQTIYILHPMN